MKLFVAIKRGRCWAGTAVVACVTALVYPSILARRDNPTRRTAGALVSVPGGTFVMGSRETEEAGKPESVRVEGFFLGQYEVTVGEYVRYLNAAGAGEAGLPPEVARRRGRFAAAFGKSKFPVTNVSREDAERYCAWISKHMGRCIRLPTEVEWEYAARAGIHGARYPWGWGDPEGRACFAARGPRRVGRYAPNVFGLYDMAGNVFEWCAGGAEDGRVPARGGSWAERDPRLLRVYRRVWFPPDYRDRDVGFRVAADAGGETK